MPFARPNPTLELIVGLSILAIGLLIALVDSLNVNVATVKIDGLCCRCVSEPILRQIRSVSDVKTAKANHEDGEVYVRWSSMSSVPAEDIWKAAHRGAVRPSAISVNGRAVPVR